MNPIKFHIQPVVYDWNIFTKGIKAAGFDLISFDNESNLEASVIGPKDYHYSISLPVPLYLTNLINPFKPFRLVSEVAIFSFDNSIKKGPFVSIYSDEYAPKELSIFAEKVMKHIIQQYSYLSTLFLFRPRDYAVVGESLIKDNTIKVSLRRWSLSERFTEEITVLAGPQKEEIAFEINPEGILYFDLSQLESENREKYIEFIKNKIGVKIDNQPTQNAVMNNPVIQKVIEQSPVKDD